MKSSHLVIPSVTGILGLALGIAMAPRVRTVEAAGEAPSAVAKSIRHQSAGLGGITSEEGRKTTAPSRSRDRGEEKKSKEPQISIPLKTMVGFLKESQFKYGSGFDSLESSMIKALNLLGATDREREEIVDLVKRSQAEIHAAEKASLKLGEVTAERINIDVSGMQGPAEEIARRTQDGIRAALPSDMGEGLLSAIDWEAYYPAEPAGSSFVEITRSNSGRLKAHQQTNRFGRVQNLSSEFKDDGTPLPADQAFKDLIGGDRWLPLLKGLTLLPKNEE
jgi:hypothetical protein